MESLKSTKSADSPPNEYERLENFLQLAQQEIVKKKEKAGEKQKLFDDKVECLKNEIKTYKHENSSLQQELKTEKSRSDIYIDKFEKLQSSLLSKNNENDKLKKENDKLRRQVVVLLGGSNSFPFAIRNVPSAEKKSKGNRVVLAQDTCSYQIPETMELVAASPPSQIPNSFKQKQLNAWKNSQQKPQLVTSFKDTSDSESFCLDSPKRMKRPNKPSSLDETFFDPDETRFPAVVKPDSDEDSEKSKEQLSIPDTPPQMDKSRDGESRGVVSRGVESDSSPSLLPNTAKSSWLRQAKKRAKLNSLAAAAKKRKLEESCSKKEPQDSLNRKKLSPPVAISPIKSTQSQSSLLSMQSDAEDEAACRSFTNWDDIFNKTEGKLETTRMQTTTTDDDDVKENTKTKSIQIKKEIKQEIEDDTSNIATSKHRSPPPPPRDDDVGYKYETVTRGRAERDKLDGKACPQCEAYYSDLPDDEKAVKLKEICRHKKVYHPPSTPECYWELGIPNTEECLRRGYITNESTQLAVATRNRGNRRKPYKSRFLSKK